MRDYDAVLKRAQMNYEHGDKLQGEESSTSTVRIHRSHSASCIAASSDNTKTKAKN
jgi:hypothetical protein